MVQSCVGHRGRRRGGGGGGGAVSYSTQVGDNPVV